MFPLETSCFMSNPTFLQCMEGQGTYIYIYIYIDSGDIKQLISGGAGRLMDRDRWLKGR